MLLGRAGVIGSAVWAPTDIEGCFLWFAANLETGYSDNDGVSIMTDQTGIGNSFLQATGAKQPVYKTNILSTYPIFRFDGSNHSIGIGTATTLHAAADFTFFFVTANQTAGAWDTLFDCYNGRVFLLAGNGSAKIAYYVTANGYQGGSVAGVTNPSITTFLLSSAGGNTAAIYVNGSAINSGLAYTQTALAGSGATVGIVLGAEYNFASSFFQGDIAEVIIYDTALGATDRGTVESYLSSKYGISLV